MRSGMVCILNLIRFNGLVRLIETAAPSAEISYVLEGRYCLNSINNKKKKI
jgi:hypothetical protein